MAASPQPTGTADYLSSLFSLNGKVAVVFGGTGELCGCIARGLYDAGASVVIVGRNAAKAEEKRGERDPTRFSFVPFDIKTGGDPSLVRDAVLERHGRVDVLMNGAAVNSATPFDQIDLADEGADIFAINVNFVARCCQVFLPDLLEARGSIINVGSISALTPLSKVFLYSASKAALHNLTKNLAREYGEAGLRVNVLVPGFFPAEQNRAILSEARVKQIMDHTPTSRFGDPSELVPACIMLASERASSFINGAEIVVDGGFAATKI